MMPTINLEIVDSRDDSKMTYVILDSCQVKVAKVKLNDLCYIMRLINNECHVDLDVKGCEAASK